MSRTNKLREVILMSRDYREGRMQVESYRLELIKLIVMFNEHEVRALASLLDEDDGGEG